MGEGLFETVFEESLSFPDHLVFALFTHILGFIFQEDPKDYRSLICFSV